MSSTATDFCREIERYLCQKNDGHLIRVVGPSFDLVPGWIARGVPLNVAFSGIDRSFERYHRKSPRRRPLKIDFCEADVLDAFDEWRRALGLTSTPEQPVEEGAAGPGRATTASLPAHLERVVLRLTRARAGGVADESFEPIIDAVARELDRARASAHGIRGEARQALLARLTTLDRELVDCARAALDEATRAAVQREAEAELAPFHARMSADAFARARERAIDRLARARF